METCVGFLRPCKSPTKPPLDNRTSKSVGSSPRRFRTIAVAAQQDPNSQQQQQQQLDLSVLRFTFGIPGFDESYLPRIIGATLGALIVANHFLSPSSPSPAQLRSEALGVCLAAFSTALPYLGKFLKGANPIDRSSLPEGNKQIFILSQNVSGIQKEDLAWGSYVLLRNTNTMSVAIAVQDALCVRGYWNTPENYSKSQLLEWFKSQIKQVGLLELKDTLYFPQSPDNRLQGMLPKGVCSLLVEPLYGVSSPVTNTTTNIKGFVLLASSSKYAYTEKDRAWIRAIANKFQGSSHVHTGASVEISPLLYNWPRFDRFSAIWVASGEGKSCNKKPNQRLLSDKISEFNPLWLCSTTISYFHIELTIGSDLDSTISTLL